MAWSMQASLEFGSEMEQACRWPAALQWQELSPAQRARSSETSPSTVVTDTIRKIDHENARYGKLLGALASSIDATGLQVAETDLVAVLLRSLPESVRTFCLHHTSGETYQSFRAAALRWDSNKGLLQNSNPRNSCTS